MKYKDIKKDVFVDGYKWPDMVEDCKKFLNIIKDHEPYLIKFEENRSIKTKNYPNNCVLREDVGCSIIVIIYNEYIFSSNDEIWKV